MIEITYYTFFWIMYDDIIMVAKVPHINMDYLQVPKYLADKIW